jgi:hypothetical protein
MKAGLYPGIQISTAFNDVDLLKVTLGWHSIVYIDNPYLSKKTAKRIGPAILLAFHVLFQKKHGYTPLYMPETI